MLDTNRQKLKKNIAVIEKNIKSSLSASVSENLLGEVQSRDEINNQLSAELEGSKEDVNRMMEELKNKEQEHATETAELINKNSELTEMLDDTMEKLDASQEEVEEHASRLAEAEVQTFTSHCPCVYINIHSHTAVDRFAIV